MRSLLILPLLAISATAGAQDYDTGVPPAVTVEGSATVLSDYRFRGVSQSDGEPAAQAGVTVRHESGLAAGALLSTQQGRDPADPLFGAGDVRTELFASFTHPFASGLRGEVGVTAYLFPDRFGGRATDWVEPYAALAYDLGPAQARVSAAWAPSAPTPFGRDEGLYLGGDLTVGVPTTPFTVTAHVGRAGGSLARRIGTTDGDRVDWSLGVQGVRGPFVGGLRYVDTDAGESSEERLGADAAVVLFAGVRF